MYYLDHNSREVEVEIAGPLDDIQITSAVYTDTGEEASEESVEYIQYTYADSLYETRVEQFQGEADSLYDMEREGNL